MQLIFEILPIIALGVDVYTIASASKHFLSHFSQQIKKQSRTRDMNFINIVYAYGSLPRSLSNKIRSHIHSSVFITLLLTCLTIVFWVWYYYQDFLISGTISFFLIITLFIIAEYGYIPYRFGEKLWEVTFRDKKEILPREFFYEHASMRLLNRETRDYLYQKVETILTKLHPRIQIEKSKNNFIGKIWKRKNSNDIAFTFSVKITIEGKNKYNISFSCKPSSPTTKNILKSIEYMESFAEKLER